MLRPAQIIVAIKLVILTSVTHTLADGPIGMCLFDLDGTLTTLQVLARGVLARVRCIF